MKDVGYLVVTSTKAGSAREKRVELAAGTLAGHGPTEVVRTEEIGALGQALDGLDGRVLVVAGGDGSLHAVAQHLWDRGESSETTLGLVPLGTGNDFARGVGLPLDPLEAAEAVGRGKPRRLDLLIDEEGMVVVNVVHAGLGAEAAEDAKALKGPLGPLAYPVGALIAALDDEGWELDVEVDGTPVGGGAELMVGVGNGKTIGGGTPLCPLASPDDGLLDVVVVNATGPAARVAFGAALRKGKHLDRDDVHHTRGHQVRIGGDPIRHNADGEISEELTSRTYRVVPSSWPLLMP